MKSFRLIINQHPYLFSIILGAIYPLGLAPLEWWPFLFISLYGLVELLHSQPDHRWLRLFFCYGLGFFGVGASWVYVSIHSFGNAPVWLSIVLTFAFVAFLACCKALVGWGLMKIQRKTSLSFALSFFPLVWVLVDLFQATFLTGFPWLFMGYGLSSTWLSPWLGVVGSYGLTFIGVFLSAIVYLLLNAEMDKAKKSIGMLSIIFVVLLPFLFKTLSDRNAVNSQSISVALVQPNIAQEEKWEPSKLQDYLKDYDKLTEPYWGHDLIIWPEAAIPALRHRVENWIEHFRQKAVRSGTELVLGIPIYDREKERIFASLISVGETEARYDKQHLVPFGEYVPFEKVLRGLIEFFNLPMSAFEQGSDEQSALKLRRITIIPAICYEITYSSTLLNLRQKSGNHTATSIVTISNDAWFGQSWGPDQHYQIAKVRGIELGIPVIRATNNGITAISDLNGSVLSKLSKNEKNVLSGNYNFKNTTTLFVYFGFPITVTFILFFTVFFVIFVKKNVNK